MSSHLKHAIRRKHLLVPAQPQPALRALPSLDTAVAAMTLRTPPPSTRAVAVDFQALHRPEPHLQAVDPYWTS